MNLKINNLSKTYSNGTKALNDISLEVSNGMFGLLGPNGAGKSSLMRTLVTLQEADGGTAMLGDIDMLNNKDELRNHIGYLPQEFGLYPKVSAQILLNHFAALKGITDKDLRKKTVDQLLEKVNLTEHRSKKLGGFSGGMKQRFGIAQALIGDPKLIIVDEPTAGLDPMERNRFHNILSELGRDTIVILSTHIVEDVKDLCTNMAILNKGKILVEGNPKKLVNDMQGQVWEKPIDQGDLANIKRDYQVISDRFYDGQIMVRIISQSDPNNGFQQTTTGLEDVYFNQVNQSLNSLS